MKTQAIRWPGMRLAFRQLAAWNIPNAGTVLRALLFLLSGAVPFALVAIIVTWLSGAGGQAYLSAVSWAAGFVFLALALDDDRGRATVFGVTGLALISLALMGSRFAPEFGVLAGLVLGAWLAVPTMKYVELRACGSAGIPRG